MGANLLEENGATAEQRRQVTGHDVRSKIFARYQRSLVHLDLAGIAMGRQQCLDAVKAVGRLSLNADKSAPISLSPAGNERVWQDEEVQAAVGVQEQAKQKAIAVHGSLTKADKSAEGDAYREAYKNRCNVVRRLQRFEFEQERAQWFSLKDERVMDQIAQESNSGNGESDQFVNAYLPDEHQEQDINNLHFSALYETSGHMDINNLTGANILEGGAINYLRETDVGLAPADHCTRLAIYIEPDYDPSHHYPSNILFLLFGGISGNSLEDRFDLLRLLQSLPAKKTIPRSHFDSLYYRNEAPTVDMKCPLDNTDMKVMTASQRAIHLHSCTITLCQGLADSIQEHQYPMPATCPWSNCHHQLTDFKKWKKHLHMHFHIPMENQGKVRCDISGCLEETFLYNMDDVRRHVMDVHKLATEAKGFVEFCYWCHYWFFDSADWTFHQRKHHNTLFGTIERCKANISLAAVVTTGITVKPGLCPVCIADESKPIDQRMHQHSSSSNLTRHLINCHHAQLISQNVIQCGLTCCRDVSSFSSIISYYNHVISAHEIPLGGKRGGEKLLDGTWKPVTLQSLDDLAVKPRSVKQKRKVGQSSGEASSSSPQDLKQTVPSPSPDRGPLDKKRCLRRN